MDKIIAWAFVALFGTVVVTDAYALTIPSGSVLTKDGVVPAAESDNTRKQVERNGYAVVAGQLVVGIEGELITIDLDDLRGKDKDGIRDVVQAAAIEQLTEAANSGLDVIEANDLQDAIASVEHVAEENRAAFEEAIEAANEAVAEATDEINNVLDDIYDRAARGEITAEEADRLADEACGCA